MFEIESEKCCFGRPKPALLGHVIRKDGIQVDLGKPKKVLIAKKNPSTKTKLSCFLALASYYRRFIRNFAKRSTPLSTATPQKQSFRWYFGYGTIF